MACLDSEGPRRCINYARASAAQFNRLGAEHWREGKCRKAEQFNDKFGSIPRKSRVDWSTTYTARRRVVDVSEVTTEVELPGRSAWQIRGVECVLLSRADGNVSMRSASFRSVVPCTCACPFMLRVSSRDGI